MSKARLEFDERELADDVSSGGETDAAVTVTTTNIPTSPVRRGGEHGNSDSSNDNEKAWSQPPRDVRGRGTSNEQEQQQREESQRSQKRTHQDIGCSMEEKEDDAVQPRHSKKSRHGHDNDDCTSTSTTSSNNTYMGRRDSSVYKVMVKSILGSQAFTEEPCANEELLAGYLDINGPAASDSDENSTRPNSSCSEDTPALASQSSSSVAEAAVTKSLAKLEVNNNNNNNSNSKDPLTSHKLSILKEELLAHGIVIRKDGTLEDLNEATAKHVDSQPLDDPQKQSMSSNISQAQAKLLEQKINALILERNQAQNDCRLWESKYNDLKLVQRTKVQQTVTQLQQQVQEKDEQLLAQQQGTQKMKLKFQQVAQAAKQQFTLLKRENATLKREYQTLRLNQSNQRPPSPISQALERRINELIQERDQLQAHANSHQSQVRTLQRQVSQLQQQVQEKDQQLLASRQPPHYATNYGGDNNNHHLMQENDRLKQENYRLLQQLESQKRRHDIFAMNFSEFEKASANMEAVGGFNSPPSS